MYSIIAPAEVRQQLGSSDLRYKIFAILWAIATLFHLAKSRIFTSELIYMFVTVAAIFLLFKPASLTRFLLLLSLQVLEVFIHMPHVSNHWLFTALVNLTILHGLVYLIIKKKNFRVDKGELLETFAPLVRIELIILYFYAVFHKLNTGFFTPGTSCASEFLVAQNPYSLLPTSDTVLLLNAYFTIIVETLIPLLLLFRKTRNWGILAGLLFHCFIAYSPINGFFDFSSMIFALYFLFTDNSFSDRVYGIYRNLLRQKEAWQQRILQGYSLQKLAALASLALVGLLLVILLDKQLDDYFRLVGWTLYSFTYIIVFILLTRRHETGAQVGNRRFSAAHWSLLLIPLIVFLNGLSPYLGLKTETSYAMFSNLRTEGGISNHFFVPASVQIFDFQKDMVEVIASSDPKLQRAADRQELLVFFRFKNYVAGKKPEHITYIRNGQQHTFKAADAPKDDELLHRSPYFWNKLLKFRNISKYEPQPCAH